MRRPPARGREARGGGARPVRPGGRGARLAVPDLDRGHVLGEAGHVVAVLVHADGGRVVEVGHLLGDEVDGRVGRPRGDEVVRPLDRRERRAHRVHVPRHGSSYFEHVPLRQLRLSAAAVSSISRAN